MGTEPEKQSSTGDYNWKKDLAKFYLMMSHCFPLSIIAVIAIVSGAFLPALPGAKDKATSNEVVIYTSQDQVYAEPILKEFEQQTGMKVLAVFDSESVKTFGLVNRLIAEKDRPQCDLFWNNEE